MALAAFGGAEAVPLGATPRLVLELKGRKRRVMKVGIEAMGRRCGEGGVDKAVRGDEWC